MFQYIFCFTFWPGAIWRSFATWGHWGTGRQLRHLICRAGSQPLFERLWVESLPFHLGEEKAVALAQLGVKRNFDIAYVTDEDLESRACR